MRQKQNLKHDGTEVFKTDESLTHIYKMFYEV